MRARHRHFNPRDIGASQVLDSRFLSGSRPTYKTSIQGGQPIARFDGGDRMESSFQTTTKHSVVCVYKRTNSQSNISGEDVTFVLSVGISANTATTARLFQHIYVSSPSNNFLYGANANAASQLSISRNDDWNIHSVSADIGSGSASYTINGSNEQTSNVSSLSGVTSGTVIVMLGDATFYTLVGFPLGFIGDLSQSTIFRDALNKSQLKKVNHAAAFSFKIACS
jgi:hypothetical protein